MKSMSLKQWMMVAVLAASSVACVANQGDAPIRLLGARTLTTEDTGCTAGDRQLLSGSLDVSGGASYLLALNLESQLRESTNVLNDVTLTEVVLSYESQPRLSLPNEERIPIYAVIRPGTSEDSSILLDALGPKALTVLRDAVATDQAVTVLSTIQAKGHLGGGQSVETNEISFPITVINSGFDPASGKCLDASQTVSPTAEGPCGQLGQDTGPICGAP
jgi:hypothetical protein